MRFDENIAGGSAVVAVGNFLGLGLVVSLLRERAMVGPSGTEPVDDLLVASSSPSLFPVPFTTPSVENLETRDHVLDAPLSLVRFGIFSACLSTRAFPSHDGM